MSLCANVIWLQVLSFIDNQHLGSIPRSSDSLVPSVFVFWTRIFQCDCCCPKAKLTILTKKTPKTAESLHYVLCYILLYTELKTDIKLMLECLDYQKKDVGATKQALMTLSSILQGSGKTISTKNNCIETLLIHFVI